MRERDGVFCERGWVSVCGRYSRQYSYTGYIQLISGSFAENDL